MRWLPLNQPAGSPVKAITSTGVVFRHAAAGIAAVTALFAASQALADDGIGAGVIEGQCEYSSNALKLLDGANGFAACDEMAVSRNAGKASFDFRKQGFGSMVRYGGKLSGDTLAIRRIQLRNRQPEVASGTCTVYWRDVFGGDRRVSTVTCVAMVGQITYAANFVASRINLD